MNYYLGKNLQKLSNNKNVVTWVLQNELIVLIIPKSEYEEIKQNYDNWPATAVIYKKGLNYPKGRQIELLALLCN